ncbi:MAG: hypothetical protein ACLFQJ_08975 [Campylobacterales bacterium]
MNLQGLSLDQAPPYRVPMSFFATAMLYLVIGSLYILFFGVDEVFLRGSGLYYMAIHLFALGVVGNTIIGASFQMLPVLAGATYWRVELLWAIVYLSFQAGVLSLIFAFMSFDVLLFKLASIFLLVGISTFTISTIFSLKSSSYKSSSINGMRISALFFMATMLLGVGMVYQLYLGGEFGFRELILSHITFGGFGWMFLLILSVSFWVVPMFYVTSEYSRFCTVFAPLVSIVAILGIFIDSWFFYLLSIPLGAYTLTTLRKYRSRKRKIKDGVVNLWYIGSLSGFFLFLLLLASAFVNLPEVFMGVMFLFGFVLAIIFAMLFKIVPFLTWFHLSFQGYFDAPTMGEIVPSNVIKTASYLYALMFVMMVVGFFFKSFLYPAFLLLGVLGFVMLHYVVKSYRIYKRFTT